MNMDINTLPTTVLPDRTIQLSSNILLVKSNKIEHDPSDDPLNIEEDTIKNNFYRKISHLEFPHPPTPPRPSPTGSSLLFLNNQNQNQNQMITGKRIFSDNPINIKLNQINTIEKIIKNPPTSKTISLLMEKATFTAPKIDSLNNIADTIFGFIGITPNIINHKKKKKNCMNHKETNVINDMYKHDKYINTSMVTEENKLNIKKNKILPLLIEFIIWNKLKMGTEKQFKGILPFLARRQLIQRCAKGKPGFGTTIKDNTNKKLKFVDNYYIKAPNFPLPTDDASIIQKVLGEDINNRSNRILPLLLPRLGVQPQKRFNEIQYKNEQERQEHLLIKKEIKKWTASNFNNDDHITLADCGFGWTTCLTNDNLLRIFVTCIETPKMMKSYNSDKPMFFGQNINNENNLNKTKNITITNYYSRCDYVDYTEEYKKMVFIINKNNNSNKKQVQRKTNTDSRKRRKKGKSVESNQINEKVNSKKRNINTINNGVNRIRYSNNAVIPRNIMDKKIYTQLAAKKNIIGKNASYSRLSSLINNNNNNKDDSKNKYTFKYISVEPLSLMNKEYINLHVTKIKREVKSNIVSTYMSSILRKLKDHHNNRDHFNYPVDIVAQNIPHYPLKIKKPIDLGTITKIVEDGLYDSIYECRDDINLVFDNAVEFNGPGHALTSCAQSLKTFFSEEFYKISLKYEADKTKKQNHFCNRCYGLQCIICEQKCIELTSEQLYCSSSNCLSIISKGANYYSTRDGTRLWCTKCYNKYLNKGNTILNSNHKNNTNTCKGKAKSKNNMTGVIMKDTNTLKRKLSTSAVHPSMEETQVDGNKDNHIITRPRATLHPDPELDDVFHLLEKKKSEIPLDTWVKCGQCNQWMHQVCGMFNIMESAIDGNKIFRCPTCLLKQKNNINELSFKATRGAHSLPQCNLSRFLENNLLNGLKELAYENIFPTFSIRVVSSTKEIQRIPLLIYDTFRENEIYFKNNYEKTHTSSPNDHILEYYPKEISHVSKTIYLFQENDGVDVCIFAMFVQEYDNDSIIKSNRNTSYIAYLDSVRYMQPSEIRTNVYHQILIGYLDYIRRYQNIHTVYIWSCPPQRNINYVFWCHPKNQKTPTVEILRQWYISMLTKAKDKGIIKGYTTLYNRFFSSVVMEKEKNDKSNHLFKNKSTDTIAPNTGRITRRLAASECDVNDCKWPGHSLPPSFDGDFWPGELCRVIRKRQNSLISSRKNNRNKNFVYDSPETSCSKNPSNKNPSTASKELISSSSSSIAVPKVLLKDVFYDSLPGMKLYRDDMLVIDLATCTENETNDMLALVDQETSLLPMNDGFFTRNPFVSSRFAFHQLCSLNHYQFDTLRRAKHSTMMLLHHLLNANLPQTIIFCHICGYLITSNEFWRCDICINENTDNSKKYMPFIYCDWCHDDTVSHIHPLTCTEYTRRSNKKKRKNSMLDSSSSSVE